MLPGLRLKFWNSSQTSQDEKLDRMLGLIVEWLDAEAEQDTSSTIELVGKWLRIVEDAPLEGAAGGS
jgi:hypothetical protein